MDVETLKQVIEAIEHLGSEAKIVFIWYLVVTNLPTLIFGTAWTVIGCFSIAKLFSIGLGFVDGVRVRDACGVSAYSWTTEKREKACDILRREYNKQKGP